MAGSSLKGSVVVFEDPSVLVLELKSESIDGNMEFIASSFELWIGVVLHLSSLFFFAEGSLEVLHKKILLFLDPWTIDWVSIESFSIISKDMHLIIDGLSLGAGHTDLPESYGIPFVGSGLKGTFLVLESPSVLVLELIYEIVGGKIDFIGHGLELWIGVVLLLDLGVVLGESSLEIFSKNFFLVFDPWTKGWVRSESDGILGNLDHLGVDGLGLGVGHTGRPELDMAWDWWWEWTSWIMWWSLEVEWSWIVWTSMFSWNVLFSIVSIAMSVALKGTEGIFEVSTDFLKLLMRGCIIGNVFIIGVL